MPKTPSLVASSAFVVLCLVVGVFEQAASAGTKKKQPAAKEAAPPPETEEDVVRHVQKLLSDLAYPTGSASGHADDQTKAAIRSFQERSGIPATGEANKAVEAHLREAAIVPEGCFVGLYIDVSGIKPEGGSVMNTKEAIERTTTSKPFMVGGCSARATDELVQAYRKAVEQETQNWRRGVFARKLEFRPNVPLRIQEIGVQR